MDETVEMNRLAVAFQDRDSSDTDYLLIVKEAVRNEKGVQPARWSPVGLGWEYSLWPDIGERAGFCEVKQLSVCTASFPAVTTMEAYVSLYRGVIKDACSAEEFSTRFQVKLTIELDGDNVLSSQDSDKYYLESIEELFIKNNVPYKDADATQVAGTRSFTVEGTDFEFMRTAYSLSNHFTPDVKAPTRIRAYLQITEREQEADATVSSALGVAIHSEPDAMLLCPR